MRGWCTSSTPSPTRVAQHRVRCLIGWFYADLKAYCHDPTARRRRELRARFERIFRRRTGFAARARLLERLRANKPELPMALDRPDIPLHTNGSENDIRAPVIKRKISGGTRSAAGRDCRDAFRGLAKTCAKLGISFWDYLGDRLAVCRQRRRPQGFVCPACGGGKARPLQTKAATWECAGCGRQTAVTAGTILHGSKLPLTVWFWAAYLMATHSNDISARQLQRQLGLGSYRSAWLLCGKLLSGGGGCSHQGKMLVAGAVEITDGGAGRIRLAVVSDYSAESLHLFMADNRAPGAIAKTDGWSGYSGAPGVSHDPYVIGRITAHVVLPWGHRIFANLKVWGLGVYHGLRRQHLQSYLDEFVFRFNRRRTPHAAFRSLLGLAILNRPLTYNMLIIPEAKA